jgi:alditol oxidase
MTIRNWAGNVTFSTDVLHRPATVEQLQELITRTPRIRAVGTGHSFNRVADTTGELVSVAELRGSIEFRDDTVSFPAAMRYGELNPVLDGHGKALHNLGSLPHISVAGACATGTHGSGVQNGNLATAVRAIEFVDGTGDLIRLTTADERFAGTVLALGALGVVTRLTLATEPTYQVRQDVWLDLPFDAYVQNLDDVMAGGHSVSAFTSWRRPDVIDQVWVKSRTDGGPPADLAPWGGRLAPEEQHPIPGEEPSATTQQQGVPGPWHERLPHFRMAFTPSHGDELQSEWFVAREQAAGAITAVRAVADRFADALFVSELRTIAADRLWLSPMRDQASVAVHFTWRPEPAAVRDAVRVVESALEPYDPRPHWGKLFERPPRPPGLPAFRELIARYDPEHRFGNDYLERYVY